MIKARIIKFEEAKKLGLTDEGKDLSGESVCGAMCTAKQEKKKGSKPIFLEKYYVKKNGKKELAFLHQDLAKEKQEKGELDEYFDQFEKIDGIDKQKYINDNKLVITQKHIGQEAVAKSS
jgi:hypothetical protein